MSEKKSPSRENVFILRDVIDRPEFYRSAGLDTSLIDPNLSVANLLNLSDGLLSDCLHMQLICTFNTDVAHIDKALLRKGRIIARYEFRKLPVEKCSAIAEKLGSTRKIDHPMTLAEIFHLEDGDYSVNKRQAIGF